jgi:hypothetical protein
VAYPSTFLDIQNQVIAKLRLDSTADLQRVKDYINRAYAETCVETEALQTYATVALTANSQTYTLPSAVVRIKQMTVTPSGQGVSRPLVPTSIEEILEWSSQNGTSSTANGTVTHYAVNGLSEIVLYPIPASADTLTIWYVKQPTALSGTSDVPAIPEPYATRCLENGALYEAALFAKDPDAQVYKAEFELAKRAFRTHLNRMDGAMTRQFRITRGDRIIPHDPSIDIRWN